MELLPTEAPVYVSCRQVTGFNEPHLLFLLLGFLLFSL